MPKLVPSKTVEIILQALAQFSDQGAAIGEISAKISPLMPLRTLQRRLAFLVESGQINVSGHGRSLRYRLIPKDILSQEIKLIVKVPVKNRRPVGYDANFLNRYQPNTSYYLDKKTREHLQSTGHLSAAEKTGGTAAKQLLHRLLIDLSWNSSRLEGNTYSLLETQQLLEQGEVGEGKKAFETQMILNHKAAIEFLVENATLGFNRYTILNLHALLSDNLLPDPRQGGVLRYIPVGIAKTVYHPLENPQKIEECFNELLSKATAIRDPFEQAFFMMVQLPYLQPFVDVNKRVSRLAANIPFLQHSLSPLSFIEVTEEDYIDGLVGVYELNQVALLRDVFIWAYERSAARYSAIKQSLGEPDPIRLRYRELMINLIATVIQKKLNGQEALQWIRDRTQDIPKKERALLIEKIETELSGVHEGNIARYGIRPLQFFAWKQSS